MKRPLLFAISILAAFGPAAAQDTSEPAPINPLARLEPKDFAETLQRPLFAATRRPPPPPAPVIREDPPPAPPEPPALTLMGVVTDQRGTHAFVKSGSPTKTRSLSLGDDVEGWKVVEIAPRRIVLERETRKFAVALFTRRSGPSRIASTPPLRPSSGD